MGRLIDADKAIKSMQYYHDDCAKTSEYTKLGFETAIEVVKDSPTVEAIPKADYEARLKADMMAMLTELQVEIEEVPKYCMTHDGTCVYRKSEEYISDINNVIQQKINALKENKDGTNEKTSD